MGGAEAGVQPADEEDRQGGAEGRCGGRPATAVHSASGRARSGSLRARSGPYGPDLGGGLWPAAQRSLARGDMFSDIGLRLVAMRVALF